MAKDPVSDSLTEFAMLLGTLTGDTPMLTITLRSLSAATCSPETLQIAANHPVLTSNLIRLIEFGKDSPNDMLVQDCLFQVLINLSSAESHAENFAISLRSQLGKELSEVDTRAALKNLGLLDKVLAVVSNLTRRPADAQEIFDRVPEAQWRNLLQLFDTGNRDPSKPQLSFLPSVFVNLSRLLPFRKLLLDSEKRVFQRLLPFMDQKFPIAIRGGVMRLVRNCTFDADVHPWLLGEDVDLLPHLLLPLAGPEEFDEDEMQKLPVDLQYLPDDKTREPLTELRIILLEALLQLCCTAFGRKYLRDHGAYYILRELHKWEKDAFAILACENVVDPLISDEPPNHLQDFRQIDVPERLAREFDEMSAKLAEQ